MWVYRGLVPPDLAHMNVRQRGLLAIFSIEGAEPSRGVRPSTRLQEQDASPFQDGSRRGCTRAAEPTIKAIGAVRCCEVVEVTTTCDLLCFLYVETGEYVTYTETGPGWNRRASQCVDQRCRHTCAKRRLLAVGTTGRLPLVEVVSADISIHFSELKRGALCAVPG